jgi:transcriptional regulator with XRE-family HTH domain
MTKTKKFKSVSEMVRVISDSSEFSDSVEDQIKSQQLVKMLFALRSKFGVSQDAIAEKMQCSQSKISKLENSFDREITMGELEDYLDALGLDVKITITHSNGTLADEVKHCVFRMKTLLNELSEMVEETDSDGQDCAANFMLECLFSSFMAVKQSLLKLPNTKKIRDLRLEIFPEELLDDDKDEEQSQKHTR